MTKLTYVDASALVKLVVEEPGSAAMLRWYVESEVVDITPSRSKPDRGTVVVRCLTRNQNGETVQSFTPKLVVPRRPR